MKSVMAHSFSRVPKAEIQRSSFDRSHGLKTTFDAGYLIPFYVDEALPGDTFNLRANAFIRLATPLKPIMDNMFVDTFFFFVPNRLLWDNWVKMCGEQDNPDDSTDYAVPQLTAPNYAAGGVAVGSLGDYMGLPTGGLHTENSGIKFNALHFRAYNLIWNQWFRDQNLQDSVAFTRAQTGDVYADYALLRRGKRHDYFTSCLPWPQKGPDILLPMGDEAPVELVPHTTSTNASKMLKADDDSLISVSNIAASSSNGLLYTGSDYLVLDPNGRLTVDLTDAVAVTINQMREAFQLQKLHERDARGGTRYTEIVRAHFGVVSPDARLQRPEYLGGGSSVINCHPVAQTTAKTTASGWATTPQGNLSAFGTGSFQGHGFTKSFTEHGVLIGLMSVRADLTYQQGLNRMWSRQTRYDFFWPALGHLGEQEVLNKEIYCQGEGVTSDPDNEPFGYQERYAEYRYKPSQITGQFRSTYSTPLDMWHLSQEFESLPALDTPGTFIEENPPVDRCIAVDTEPHFLADVFIGLKCARPMPVYSVPGLMDHF